VPGWKTGDQQHEASRQGERSLDPGDGDRAGLERLTEGVQRIGAEMERLIQEEDAAVRERSGMYLEARRP
jgi:hypothetical protein